MTPPPTCERCGGAFAGCAKDFRGKQVEIHRVNSWDVAVGGECPYGPVVVEEGDAVTTQIDLCDVCARKPCTPSWCLVHALRLQLGSREDEGELTPDEARVSKALDGLTFGRAVL